MKFEIKSWYTGNILFSVETESLKLAVELGVKAKTDLRSANLRSADLRYADLRYANLSSADLSSADLRYADLRYADLRYANLSSADLSSADLRYANLRSADLSSAKGINKNLITPLRILLDQPGPIWAYKLVNEEGEGPFNGGINYLNAKEAFSASKLDPDEMVQCGEGINLATLDWCMKEWRPSYRILIMEFFAHEPKGNLVIPTATDGKFRVKQCRRVGEKNLKELGLVK